MGEQQQVQLTSSSMVQLQSNELQIGSYSSLKSYKNQLTLTKDASVVVTLYDGPLFSSITATTSTGVASNLFAKSSPPDQQQVSKAGASAPFSYESSSEISEPKLVQVTALDADYHLNRYSYRVKCLGLSENAVAVRFQVSHKRTQFNKCPVKFDYQIRVRCAQPHSLELAQLFVKNEESTQALHASLKWKCPIKLSSNLIIANLDRPLYVQLLVRDSLNNLFDNFTSHQIEWQIEKKNLLDLPRTNAKIRTLQLANYGENSLAILSNDFELETLNSNLVFYQSNIFNLKKTQNKNKYYIHFKVFNTKSKLGDSKLTAKLFLDTTSSSGEDESAGTIKNNLIKTLNVHFVSDAKLQPDTLTIFNHPSNVISLSILRGSGYYHAEIETIKVNQAQLDGAQLKQNQQDSSSQQLQMANVLKIR